MLKKYFFLILTPPMIYIYYGLMIITRLKIKLPMW